MSDTILTKHRSARENVERGIYRRASSQSHTGWLYSVAHGGKFVSTEADNVTKLYEVTAARARRGELIGASRRGEKPVLNSRLTFGELAEQWLEAKAPRLRPRTKAYYEDALRLVLLPRFDRMKIAAIDVEAIARLVRDLEARGLNAVDPKRPVRPLGRSSIENYLKPLGQVLDLAVRRRLIVVNPMSLLGKDERPQRGEQRIAPEFSDEIFDRLFAASAEIASEPASRQSYEFLLRLTQRLALRLGETLGLQWGDIDKDRGVLHIRRQWLRSGEYGDPKTVPHGIREIVLPTGLQNELLALRLSSKHSGNEQPIFASRTGSPLSHRNVTRRGLEAARERAGLPELQFHDLRRAGISRWIANGVPPVTAAKMAGHRDAKLTIELYTKIFNADDEAVREALA